MTSCMRYHLNIYYILYLFGRKGNFEITLQIFLSEIESDYSIFTLIIVKYFSEFSYDSMKFDMIILQNLK